MARIRTFKPDMATSRTLSRIPREVLYTWQQIWPHCDDKGRFHGDPLLIWAAVYPLRDDIPPIALMAELEMLASLSRLCCYRGCDEKVWMHVLGWDHQKIDRPSESRIPPCRYHDPDDKCPTHGETRCASSPASFLDAAPVSSDDPQVVGRTSPKARETLARKTPDAGEVVPITGDAPVTRETLASPRPQDLVPRTTDLVPGTKNMTVPRSAAPDDTTATRRGTRIPEPFTVDAAMRGWAHERGWSDADIAEATEEFVDYWRGVPGARGTKLDWPATWKNRLRDQERRFRVQRSPGPDKVEHGLRLAERLASEGR